MVKAADLNGAPGRAQDPLDMLGSWKDSTGISWADAEPDALRNMIVAVTGAGAALVLSRTQDQGALSLQVIRDDKRKKFYPNDKDDLHVLLVELRRTFTAE